MENIPLLNLVPEKYRGWVLFAVWLAPYVSRYGHALYAGDGIVGALRGVLFGTNGRNGAATTAAEQIKHDTYHAPEP